MGRVKTLLIKVILVVNFTIILKEMKNLSLNFTRSYLTTGLTPLGQINVKCIYKRVLLISVSKALFKDLKCRIYFFKKSNITNSNVAV